MTSIDRFDYALPPELIAQEPTFRRDASRALTTVRYSRDLAEVPFSSLPDQLRGDECLVVNDTRVIPARVRARRRTGGAVEIFLLREEGGGIWRAWLSPARRVKPGETLERDGEPIEVRERLGDEWRVWIGEPDRLRRLGEIPLPPYIDRSDHDPRLRGLDAERYQTIFAEKPGAVAAPTAGLHFTPELLARLRSRSIPVVSVTLHVGPGTFRPISTVEVESHRVDPERYEVTAAARRELSRARIAGRRIVCVGTTSLRVIESLETLDEGPDLRGRTNLTVSPGFAFRHAEGLITNFHLPRSSLLVLVTAFHGYEQTMAAYQHAIESRFRFYSYGDAMIILPPDPGC